jgi:hypothetical protein
MTTSAQEKKHDDNGSGVREERWFVVRMILLLAFCIAAFVGLVFVRGQFSGSVGLPRTRLPDGTWLVARGVTVGTNHVVDIPYALKVQMNRWDRGHHQSTSTNTPRMAIWLTRENDRGEFLDLNWFKRCELILGEGDRAIPNTYHYDSVRDYGSGSSGTGSDGYSDAQPFGSNSSMDMALIYFDLPLVRPNGTPMILRVYDGSGAVVAELPLDRPALTTIVDEVWEPDPLPATRTDGNLSVTMTGFKKYPREDWQLPSLAPQLTFVHDGQESKTWVASHQFVDQLGNVSNSWNCDLSNQEAAWKMQLTMTQTANGRFLPEETTRLPSIPLTKARTFAQVSQSWTLNGASVSLLGLGGTGPLEFTLPSSTAEFRTAPWQPGQHSGGMSSRSNGSLIEVDFTSGGAFLVTREILRKGDSEVQLVLRDQEGTILPTNLSSTEGLSFWFFDPKPTTTSIEVELIVQKYRHAEFIVAPPK